MGTERRALLTCSEGPVPRGRRVDGLPLGGDSRGARGARRRFYGSGGARLGSGLPRPVKRFLVLMQHRGSSYGETRLSHASQQLGDLLCIQFQQLCFAPALLWMTALESAKRCIF